MIYAPTVILTVYSDNIAGIQVSGGAVPPFPVLIRNAALLWTPEILIFGPEKSQ
jgi:hypothetical protein